MIRRLSLALSLLLASAVLAQPIEPLRSVSGTTPGAGASPWVTTGTGPLTFFHGFDAHLTYLSQTGPEEQENDVFSTNWFGAGVQFDLGERAFVLARGRVSLEPYTIEENGYPQFFQYVPEDGLRDRMRAHDLWGEAGVQIGFRPTMNTMLFGYGALVGQPALGPAPAQLRASGVDFAEAPFGYEFHETMHDSTKVVTAGFSTRFFTIEGSVFHDAFTTGDHTELDTDGDIDSRSARLTITPSRLLAIQVSRGELGEGLAESEITSASISYGGPWAALTALYTSRDLPNTGLETRTAYGLEVALRGGRSTFLVRAEHVDRPGGFPRTINTTAEPDAATHYTAGYLFDFAPRARYKLGVGVNIDYRTDTHDLEDLYGHKPQGIYTFVRFRT